MSDKNNLPIISLSLGFLFFFLFLIIYSNSGSSISYIFGFLSLFNFSFGLMKLIEYRKEKEGNKNQIHYDLLKEVKKYDNNASFMVIIAFICLILSFCLMILVKISHNDFFVLWITSFSILILYIFYLRWVFWRKYNLFMGKSTENNIEEK